MTIQKHEILFKEIKDTDDTVPVELFEGALIVLNDKHPELNFTPEDETIVKTLTFHRDRLVIELDIPDDVKPEDTPTAP